MSFFVALYFTIYRKNNLQALSESSVLNRGLFKIESNFAELNPDKVTLDKGQEFDSSYQIKLLTNDKAGKSGRATWFIADRDVIKVNDNLIDKWKVIVSSANAGGQKRDNQLEILPPHTAFGRSRIALKMFDSEVEAKNFYQYVSSYLIRFAFLMTDESLTSLAKAVPDILDYSDSNNLIDFTKNIDKQFQQLLGLTTEQMDYIKEKVDNLRK